MKFIIIKYTEGYHIQIKEMFKYDRTIAEYLDLSLKKYQNILKSHNAYLPVYYYLDYYFKNLEDAEEAVIELEPYLIMVILMEE